MGTEEVINTTIGAVVSLKVIETGFKMIDKQTKKGRKQKGFL